MAKKKLTKEQQALEKKPHYGGADSYPIKESYIDHTGAQVTIKEVNHEMTLKSITHVAKPTPKFKTLVDKIDDELFAPEKPIYYPSEIFPLFKKAKPEIDRLWQYVYDGYKNSQKKPNEERTDLEILKHFSLKWIGKNKTTILKKKYFEDKIDHLFEGEQYPEARGLKRSFIGRLLQIIISDHLPKILSTPKKATKNYGQKTLYELYSTKF